MSQSEVKRNLSLNGNQLKLIAIAAMTTDHLAWVIFPGYSANPLAIVMHIIGRLTAPIMCFFISEGFFYTHNLKKYILRMFLFAVPSHFAYLFAFGHPFVPDGLLNQTSVLWPFAFGLVALALWSSGIKQIWKVLGFIAICIITFPSDWSCIAVLVILGFYYNRGNLKNQTLCLALFAAFYAVVYCIFLDMAYGLLQMCVLLSVPLLYLYNGERGNVRWRVASKWGFYIYYPLHLFLIGLLRLALK